MGKERMEKLEKGRRKGTGILYSGKGLGRGGFRERKGKGDGRLPATIRKDKRQFATDLKCAVSYWIKIKE